MKPIPGDQRWTRFGLACAAVVMGVAVVALLALTRGGGPPQAAASHGTVTVDVGDYWFCSSAYQGTDPSVFCETTIHAGDTIKWHRVEGFHNVAECGTNWSKWDGSDCAGTDWKSPFLTSTSPDWSRTFTTAGTFYYLCEVHGLVQKGKVVVLPAPTPTPTPTPVPETTITTIGKGQSPVNNPKVHHHITGLVVDGPYRDTAHRIKFVPGSSVTAVVHDHIPGGDPTVIALTPGIACNDATNTCTVTSLTATEKYKAVSADGTDTDRITFLPD